MLCGLGFVGSALPFSGGQGAGVVAVHQRHHQREVFLVKSGDFSAAEVHLPSDVGGEDAGEQPRL
mgnify:CR=1 FL=1